MTVAVWLAVEDYNDISISKNCDCSGILSSNIKTRSFVTYIIIQSTFFQKIEKFSVIYFDLIV